MRTTSMNNTNKPRKGHILNGSLNSAVIHCYEYVFHGTKCTVTF